MSQYGYASCELGKLHTLCTLAPPIPNDSAQTSLTALLESECLCPNAAYLGLSILLVQNDLERMRACICPRCFDKDYPAKCHASCCA